MRNATALATLLVLGASAMACDPMDFLREAPDLTAIAPPPADPPIQTTESVKSGLDEAATEIGLQPSGDGYVYLDPDRKFAANVAADGTVAFVAPPGSDVVAEQGLRISGPADWAIRGGEAKSGPAKLAFLEKTSDLRSKMALNWYDDRVARQIDKLDDELTAIWNSEHISMTQRRRMLFLRWDECEEGLTHLGSATAEEAASLVDVRRASAGTDARHRIEAFIRRKLAADGPNAYPAAELEQLNGERSTAERFAPYEDVPKNAG